MTDADNIRIDNEWRDIDINTHGGDDTITVDASKQARQKFGSVSISGGLGNDRINIENQISEVVAGVPTPTDNTVLIAEIRTTNNYFLSDSAISIVEDVGGSPFLSQPSSIDFSGIEEVRFRAALDARNTLAVTPSAQTKFIVDAVQRTSDDSIAEEDLGNAVLEIAGPLASEAVVAKSSTSGTGAVLFGDAARNVHFFNLDEIDLGFETFPV